MASVVGCPRCLARQITPSCTDSVRAAAAHALRRSCFSSTRPSTAASGKPSGKASAQRAGWLRRQSKDPYVDAAVQNGVRSRAAFKLSEMNAKHKFLSKAMRVVDLGAAPGGWSVVAAEQVGPLGQVISIDLLPISPIKHISWEFIQGDFTDPETQDAVHDLLRGGLADVVLSDMAPSFTGDKMTDHLRTLDLGMQALRFAEEVLTEGGAFVCKYLKGADERELKDAVQKSFRAVKVAKPQASRQESSESFLVAWGFQVDDIS